MKLALVNTYDIEGGAARAALRLHQALRSQGVDSALFVQQRTGGEDAVHGPPGHLPRVASRLRWQADQLPGQLAGARRGEFSVNWLGDALAKRLRAFAPDIVHLHWVNAGFVSLHQMRQLGRPLFWTAHDMWPFTGGCHYDRGCGRFSADQCRPCPMQLRWPSLPLARQRLAAKVVTADQASIDFVAPSRWMAGVAKASPVARDRPVHVVANAIDTTRFRPIDRHAARDLFSLPQERTVLLFGGVLSNTDPRKGFALLDAALAQLAAAGRAGNVSLAVFGSAMCADGRVHGIPVRFVGHLHDDESLVALYSAADVFLAPSLQDNLPNTVLEAAACARPTVAFDIGGMADLIEHGVSGWLAKPQDPDSLATGIARAVDDPAWRQGAGAAARRHVEANFSYPTIARAHMALYAQRLRSSP